MSGGQLKRVRFDHAGLALDGDEALEAAHWLCRMHLKNGEPEKAFDLASKWVSKAADSSYLVRLKMDQADSLHDMADRRAESIEQYLRTAIKAIIPNASGEHEIIAFGLILMLIMIFLPEGLFTGLVNAVRRRYAAQTMRTTGKA